MRQNVDSNNGAHQVIVSHNKPAKNCKFLGQVSGDQGNFFTGDFTSNKNLEKGAMNDIRNEAAKINANYVELLTNRASSTGAMYEGTGGSNQTGVMIIGNAYFCQHN